MYIIGIDPGSEKSAVVVYDSINNRIDTAFKDDNENIILWINDNFSVFLPYSIVGIERVAGYGMAVGDTVFDTADWAGRFRQAIYDRYKTVPVHRLKRKSDICMNLCHSTRAKDGNIMLALIDRFADVEKHGKYGKGTKKNPGYFYGFADDMWQAFAVAVCTFDKFVTDTKF